MYPVAPRAAAAVLVALSFATQLARLHGLEARPLSTATWLGAGAVFSFLLTLRLMDELKDVDVDRALFPDRPLPSGRVRESDLAAALAVSISLFVAAHVFSGPALASAVVVVGYAALMFRWFFVPDRMRPNLPLTLATHTPVIPLLLLHLVVVFAVWRGLEVRHLHAPAVAALVISGWAALFAWEIARKIRAPEEEDAYVTYSRLLGTHGAVALAASAQTLSVGLGLWLFHHCGFSSAYLLPAVGGYLVALGGHARFLRSPSPATSRLRPFAETQVFGLLLGGVLA
jgi:4-hydroxybenzoate polyprenyltransferase